MRRLLAILLLTCFGFPSIAPLLAQMDAADSKLPMCCRRAGAHHCTRPAEAASHEHVWTARCPFATRSEAASLNLQDSLHPAPGLGLQVPATATTVIGEAETARRIARERSRHKRGPPAVALAA